MAHEDAVEEEENMIRSSVQPRMFKKSTSKDLVYRCPYCKPPEKSKEELVN
jgi:hypothetical protein